MPINVDKSKGPSPGPSYPDSELYRTMCDTNDFKTLPAETIADRHGGALDQCNCLAVDTNEPCCQCGYVGLAGNFCTDIGVGHWLIVLVVVV